MKTLQQKHIHYIKTKDLHVVVWPILFSLTFADV